MKTTLRAPLTILLLIVRLTVTSSSPCIPQLPQNLAITEVRVQTGSEVDQIDFVFSDGHVENHGAHWPSPDAASFKLLTEERLVTIDTRARGDNHGLKAIRFVTDTGRSSPWYGDVNNGSPETFTGSAHDPIVSITRLFLPFAPSYGTRIMSVTKLSERTDVSTLPCVTPPSNSEASTSSPATTSVEPSSSAPPTTPAPSTVPDAECEEQKEWSNCKESKCCGGGLVCYQQNEWYAQCMQPGTCHSMYGHLDGSSHAWSCAALSTPSPPTPQCEEPAAEWGNCVSSRCCGGGLVCYQQNEWYAQCLLPGTCGSLYGHVAGGDAWTCEVLSATSAHSIVLAPTARAADHRAASSAEATATKTVHPNLLLFLGGLGGGVLLMAVLGVAAYSHRARAAASADGEAMASAGGASSIKQSFAAQSHAVLVLADQSSSSPV